VGSWERVADLPLEIDDYALERLQLDVSSDFMRVSTVVRLSGDGHEGLGEDVTYDAGDQQRLQEAGATLPLSGHWALESFCDHLATLDLWPEPPVQPVAERYRVWAYESAALDLALRQAGRPLHAVLERTPKPVRFVMSLRLPEPASVAPLRALLTEHPGLRFKLDAEPSWDAAFIEQLAQTGAVDSIDLKGLYVGVAIGLAADAALYRRIAEGLPEVWIEDAKLTDETRPVLEPHLARLTWDVPIHTVDDIVALPVTPRMVNIKPSRLGGVAPLLRAYDHCEAHGIGMYGGGQFELGVGRGQIQYLASLFHPDGPNDTAPAGYNAPEPDPTLPPSPLPVAAAATGFRWDAGS
jgi:L-alanine-DL-glutamate epimerase-like enolase superfamily enzyme